MDMNQIQAYSNYSKDSRMNEPVKNTVKATSEAVPKKHGKKLLENAAGTLVEGQPAAVYEKSDLITMLKKDTEARINQLRDMVASELKAQAGITASDDDIWKYLANGKVTVSEAAKEQAKELVSENGYYGVEQTSDRILKFAQALSGDDKSKADKLLAAFKKGYDNATKAWGKELPEICKKTYEAVEEKFNNWMSEDE